MKSADVYKLALIFSVQAEIEGMKAENTQREIEGKSLAYNADDFECKAAHLRNIAYANEEQINTL